MVDQILSGPYTGYLLHPIATHLPEYQACRLEHTGFFTQRVDTAFAFQKNSSLKSLFNYGLLKMSENGEIKRIFIKHGFFTGQENKCEGTRKGKKLGFENILVIFILLGSGMLISILLLLLENAFYIYARIGCHKKSEFDDEEDDIDVDGQEEALKKALAEIKILDQYIKSLEVKVDQHKAIITKIRRSKAEFI